MNIESVQIGDHIVTRARYGDFKLLGPVSRKTKLRVYHPAAWGKDREAYSDASSVLAAGSGEAMKLLHERLTSSLALCDLERRSALARHRDRVAKLLEGGSGEAIAALVESPSPGGTP